MNRIRITLVAAGAVTASLLAPGPCAYAQFSSGGLGGGSAGAGGLNTFNRQGTQAKPAIGGQKEQPPPALPGAAARSGAAAPVTQLPGDMPPNEALFDAINRGDIASARDALSRGADPGAHNVLGMTPMELAVDLGRNDIAFLLLSNRGARPSANPPPNAEASAQADLAKAAKQPRRVAAVGKKAVPVKAETATKPAPEGPRLFANDGGAPVPSAGFLGFDSGR